VNSSELKPCPFCGDKPVFERLGTARQSCIVKCLNCGCSLETNESGDSCGELWNCQENEQYRVALLQKVVDRLNEKLLTGLSDNYRNLILETKLED
jgi:hypothetical protein